MKIEYRRINHITIAAPAGEHEKVGAFYGGVLGLKEVERPDCAMKNLSGQFRILSLLHE